MQFKSYVSRCLGVAIFFVLLFVPPRLFAQSNVNVRVMAANLNGNTQSYQPFALRIFQGLKPDVVCIQEFNSSSVSSRKGSPMSSTDNDMRTSAAKRSSMIRDSDDLTTQVEAIRADIQNLTSTVGRIANKQLGRAQDKAMDTAHEAEEAIRRNPFSAVAIAVGLGFLFGVFTRR